MQVQAEVGASRTNISNKVNLITCYQSLQKQEICTFHYISHHFIFQKQFLVIPLIKMLDIFVDFQIILRKKAFLSWTMSDVQLLFRSLNINLLAYWCSPFLEILNNSTLYCPTGKLKPRNSEKIT